MAKSPRIVFQDSALEDPARQAMLLDRIRQMHGTGIQIDVPWGKVRKNGAYDLAAISQLVDAANARGIRPQFRLMGTSSTMQKSNPGVDMALNTTRPNAALMRTFATDIAKAFGGRVGKYSIWNEPNIGPGRGSWGSPRRAAKTYRELYQAGYAGVHAANPNAKVGFGELVGDPSAGEHGAMSQLGFMRQVLALGNKPLRADYVAMHPYQLGNPSKVSKAQVAANRDFAGISYLQNAQDAISRAFAQGRLRTTSGKRPSLTVGEFGYQHRWQPNAATRAAYIHRAMELARKAHVESVNLYQLMPSHSASNWDSSILGAQGQVPVSFRNLMPRRAAR